MQTTALRYLVRPMTVADIAQVVEVEQESFPTMWPPTAFRRELQHNRLARYLVAVERREDRDGGGDGSQAWGEGPPTGLGRFLSSLHRRGPVPPAAAEREAVVGFVGLWFLPDEAHIVAIAVRQSYRGRGIGEMLLISALELARREGQPMVSLECRVSNTVAISLYEKYGFRRVGLRRRYYSDNQEDAYILTVGPVTSRAYADTLQRLKEEHLRRWGEHHLWW